MKLPTITETAKRLGVSSRAVFAALLRHDLIGSKNLPHPIYVERGYFAVETHVWSPRGTRIQHQYAITTVTPKGMALIQDILDAGEQAVPTVQGLRGGDGNHRRAT